jgi:hypothetical protein
VRWRTQPLRCAALQRRSHHNWKNRVGTILGFEFLFDVRLLSQVTTHRRGFVVSKYRDGDATRLAQTTSSSNGGRRRCRCRQNPARWSNEDFSIFDDENRTPGIFFAPRCRRVIFSLAIVA